MPEPVAEGAVEDSPIGFVADQARRYEASGGLDGGETNGLPVLLLTCRGRRSGTWRRTPVAYHHDGDSYVLVAAARGAPVHPQWCRNLAADPRVRVQVGAERFEAIATAAVGADRARLWELVSGRFPTYVEHQRKAGRELPVVVLRRVDGGGA